MIKVEGNTIQLQHEKQKVILAMGLYTLLRELTMGDSEEIEWKLNNETHTFNRRELSDTVSLLASKLQ